MASHVRRIALIVIALLLLGQAQMADDPTTEDAASQPADGVDKTSRNAGASGAGVSATMSGKPPLPSGLDVAIIPIEGTIYSFTKDSLKRRVDRAINDGAGIIVLEINTPGGVMYDALQISQEIKAIPVPTVAWVNRQAYSAGSLLSAACGRIVMAQPSAIGDCAPVYPGFMTMGATERGKALSPLLQEFRDSARTNGYDYALLHAMCVLGAEVYLVEHKETGERRLVNQIDYKVMVEGKATDEVQPALDLDTLSTDQEYSRVAEPTLTTALDKDRSKWKPVEQLNGQTLPDGRLHDGRQPLTLGQDIAKAIGFSEATINTDTELEKHLGAASVVRVKETWSENLAQFLTRLWVRAILFIIFIVAAFIEFQAPGLGIPGAIAAIALLILLGAPLLIDLAQFWHILVFFIGLILLIVEIIATPTFGILGVVGLVLMIGSLILSAVPNSGTVMPDPSMYNRLVWALVSMLLAVVGGGVGVYAVTKYFG
ncbi:MAG: ATP-dependent Clp protease proteolytic subunit, partial [Rhodospirillales bacterium]|nr:ATP-dependent Clp protease proteolytic subunit [Rhodospirillales bacterium]